MAKLTVTVDTETKEVKANIDGQDVDMVTCVNIYCDPEPSKYSCCSFEVRTSEKGEKSNTYKSTTYSSYGSGNATRASINGDPQKFFDSIFKKNN